MDFPLNQWIITICILQLYILKICYLFIRLIKPTELMPTLVFFPCFEVENGGKSEKDPKNTRGMDEKLFLGLVVGLTANRDGGWAGWSRRSHILHMLERYRILHHQILNKNITVVIQILVTFTHIYIHASRSTNTHTILLFTHQHIYSILFILMPLASSSSD